MSNISKAQLSDYEKLAFRNSTPNVFVNVFTLPAENENELKLTAVFNLSYKFLPFRKSNSSGTGDAFFSTAELNMEVFKSPEKGLKPNKEIDVDGLESAGRASWKDTAYAASYEETKSKEQGLVGSMQVNVSPGYYTYLLQLNQDQQGPTRNSRTRNIQVQSYSDEKRENIIFAQGVDDPQNPTRLTLFSKGNNVAYGKDFYALIPLSEAGENASYSLHIGRIDVHDEDTSRVGQVHESDISSSAIIRDIQPRLQHTAQKITLQLDHKPGGYTYAIAEIPNSEFPNALYRMQIATNSAKNIVAEKVFQSYWSDIPTSLLSLDMAIDMLQFMADEDTINQIDEGTDRERERKFREFWKSKDPTPNTEFNELQAEYYRRIDYAYENYGSQNVLGFNTDRGKVYINYGPPNDINRTYPTDDATTEIWTYNNQQFVFKATSGFGDFKLVSK